jgi:hypothetical protein
MWKVYGEILKDHRLDPEEKKEEHNETILPGNDSLKHDSAMPEPKTS